MSAAAARKSLSAPVEAEGNPFRIPDVIAKELTRHLEDQIIFGELAPGARLLEEEIVQRFSVSRSPVREALHSLEREGLAVRRSRRGVWVSEIGLDDLDEVYTCRIVLEGLATELAAENRRTEDIAEIRAVLAHMTAIHKTADTREFFRANLRLSVAIHSAAHNDTLKRLLATIGKQAHRYRYLAYSRAREMMVASIEGHREVLGAIEAGKGRMARQCMEAMIERSWTAIRGHLAEEAKAAGEAEKARRA
ncbi:MAG: GntR family transcriptional regulator [Hyphomicrobiaceae bacterium]